jgi:hypothetical protein
MSVLVSIHFLAHLDAQGLQAFKDFAYLYRLHHPVQIIFDF